METTTLETAIQREASVLEELLDGQLVGDRRVFMKKGSLAAAAMAMAATWFASVTRTKAQTTAKSDLEMLTESYTLEQQAVNTYNAAAALRDSSGAPLVDGAVLSVAVAFIGDHTTHAVRFRDVIVQLGGTVPANTTATTLDAFPPGPNSQLTSLPGILRYALAVEIFAAKLWYQYAKDAQDLRVRRVFADLAPNEAAHAAILRAALKFVVGTATDHDSSNPGKAVVPFTQLSFDSPVF